MGLEVGRGTAPVRALGVHVRGARTLLCLVFRAQRPVSQGPLSRQRLPPDKEKTHTRVPLRDAREQKSLLVVSEYGVVLYVLFLCTREPVLFFCGA
jgi:hypothetical protein